MSAIPAHTALPVRDHTFYPDSDGKPMGETPIHIRNIRYAVEPLENWFADDPNVCIGANMFLYYVRGDSRRHVAPDLFVVKGVPKVTHPERRSYRTWEENGKGPDFVAEFTSNSTKTEDTRTKMRVYRDVLKVSEYFLFDPEIDYLHPPLQGHRLMNGRYLKIKPVGGRLPSEVLGLHLEADGELLRFVDPATGRRLPIPPEVQEALEEAGAEIARLKRELNLLRRRPPR
jgi:Uma2 family endonuclease